MRHTLRWTVVSGLVAMALVRCADFRAAAVEFCDVNPTALGCSGAVLDAGGTDAGAVDAGVDAGPPVYDGGAPCSAGGHPRLRCAAPIAMTQAGGMGRSALAATDDSFIAIFVRPNTNEVELYQRFADGGSTSRTYANAAEVVSVSVAGAGTQWAATWATGLTTSAPGVKCVTSSAPTSVSSVSSDVAVDVVSIDVTPAGRVGIAARSSNENVTPRAGISTSGCPGQLVEFRDPALTTQASGVAMVATADGQSFRVVSTGLLNGGSGVVSITAPQPGGGAIGVARILSGEAQFDVSAAMGGGGNWALATYDRDLEDGGAALAVKPLPVNITSNTEILIDSVTLLPWARTWNMGRCGPGCMSVAMTPTRGSLVLSVTFISDDDEMRPLGAQHYDVACSRSPNALGASVASVGDTVGVFYSDQSQGQLFLCDKPPF